MKAGGNENILCRLILNAHILSAFDIEENKLNFISRYFQNMAKGLFFIF